MLEKIQNISAGTEFQSGTSYYSGGNKKNRHKSALSNDSLLLSPGIKLLLSLGWSIKEITNLNDKLRCCLIINSLEFLFEYNKEFFMNDDLITTVVKQAKNDSDFIISLRFESEFKILNQEINSDVFEHSEIHELFNSITQLLKFSNNPAEELKKLEGRLPPKYETEFSYLIKNLIKFTVELTEFPGSINARNSVVQSETTLTDILVSENINEC